MSGRRWLAAILFAATVTTAVGHAQTAISACGQRTKYDKWCEKGEEVVGQMADVAVAPVAGSPINQKLVANVPAGHTITRIQLTIVSKVGREDIAAACGTLAPKAVTNSEGFRKFRCAAYVPPPDTMADQYCYFDQLNITGAAVSVRFANENTKFVRTAQLRVYYKPERRK